MDRAIPSTNHPHPQRPVIPCRVNPKRPRHQFPRIQCQANHISNRATRNSRLHISHQHQWLHLFNRQ